LENTVDSGNPEFVTVGIVARCCGVSNTTVLRWIERGQLRAFRLPAGHYRIASGDLARFLADYNLPVSGWE